MLHIIAVGAAEEHEAVADKMPLSVLPESINM